MSTLSIADISHLARLARLNLTEEEMARFAGQLSGVVSYVDQLSVATVNPQAPQTGVTNLINVLAADEPRLKTDLAAVNTQDLIDGAPRHDGQFIQVRAVMAGEEEGA